MPNSTRSVDAAHRIEKVISALSSLPRRTAWTIALAAFALLVLADYVTGPAYSFNALYMIDVCLAAWSIGARAALLLGVSTIAVTTALNGFGGLYLQSAARLEAVPLIWNIAMRFLNLATMLALVAGFRWAFMAGASRPIAIRSPVS